MTRALTDRQKSILDYIKGFIAKHGFPPTRREIASYFDFTSMNAAQQHLVALQSKGKIMLTRDVSRGIKVVE